MLSRDVVLQEALQLPQGDRAYLLQALEQSLDQEDFATPEIAAAWAVEIQDRLDAYDRGEMAGEDWDVALKRLQARLASDRAARLS